MHSSNYHTVVSECDQCGDTYCNSCVLYELRRTGLQQTTNCKLRVGMTGDESVGTGPPH